MKIKSILAPLLILPFLFRCSKSDDNNNQPTGTLGEVGNTWNVKVDGTHDLATKIIEKDGDVYTLEVSYDKLITKSLKFGLKGNEVVDYVYGKGELSKPFTMVKFDAKVGDTYHAEIDGIYHYREVVERKTYNIPALGKDLETIGVYEEIPSEIPSEYFGFTIREIIWYWHPDYGLVCVDVYSEEGDYINIEFVTIELLTACLIIKNLMFISLFILA